MTMKFLILHTDEQTFDEHVIGNYPVVGTADRFVIPAECFEYLTLDNPILTAEELGELGLYFLDLV